MPIRRPNSFSLSVWWRSPLRHSHNIPVVPVINRKNFPMCRFIEERGAYAPPVVHRDGRMSESNTTISPE
jgi:hypothetical protein